MRFALFITLFSAAVLSTAHIVGVTGPTTYRPGANTNYPLTFNTINGPITNEDFSVAVGLAFSSSATGGASLGTFVKNFDLENTNHGSTGQGSFTLQVPLPKDRFFNGNGQYIITTAVTNAIGAVWSVQLLFFNTTFNAQGL